jgi:tetratricopeptide (TPR) repeat protein
MSRLELPAEAALLEPLDGRDGPALRLADAASTAAIEAALERALPARKVPRFVRSRKSLLLLAAALSVTGIAAAFAAGQRWSPGVSTAHNAGVPSASLGAGSRAAPRLAEPPPLASAPTEVAGVASSGEGASSAESARTDSATERTHNVRAGAAADLLKQANQLRRQGQWADAERAYAHIASNYGVSAQGPVAALAAASLRLEHLSDPRGALRLYQSAKKAPSLSAEAELGIANCYRALGDRDAEIAALRRVTSAHPEALFHERAVRRLQALEGQRP